MLEVELSIVFSYVFVGGLEAVCVSVLHPTKTHDINIMKPVNVNLINFNVITTLNVFILEIGL